MGSQAAQGRVQWGLHLRRGARSSPGERCPPARPAGPSVHDLEPCCCPVPVSTLSRRQKACPRPSGAMLRPAWGVGGQPGPLSLSHSSDLKLGPPWVQGKDSCPPESVPCCPRAAAAQPPGSVAVVALEPHRAHAGADFCSGTHTGYKVPAPTELTDDIISDSNER